MTAGARRLLAAGALAALLAAAACGDDGADGEARGAEDPSSTTTTTTGAPSAPVAFEAGDESFYEVPDPIPAGEHGDLLRHQPTGGQAPGVTRHRLMYLSETPAGEPTVVTGLALVPEGPAPAGGWPVLSYARGSSGIADDCGISRAVDGMAGGHDDLAAEALLVAAVAPREGYVAVLTDYQGIGGPGIHSFVHGVSEARAVLDIVRAVGDLPGVEVSGDVGLVGYSQGGHAILWANQEAPTWTPELRVHGTVAGAPASEVPQLVAPGRILDGGSAALLVAGYAAADPDLDASSILTPEGEAFVDLFAETCRPDPGRAAELAEAGLLRGRPEAVEPWRSLLEANVPGQVAGASPVLLVHGDADLNVPVGDSEVLLERLCANGTPTERRVVPGADHVAGAVPTVNEGAAWLAGLLAGSQPPPTC